MKKLYTKLSKKQRKILADNTKRLKVTTKKVKPDGTVQVSET